MRLETIATLAVRLGVGRIPVLGSWTRDRYRASLEKRLLRFAESLRETAPENFRALTLGVQYTHACEVEGDIAEFGTQAGRTAVTIAAAMARFKTPPASKPKRLHLFDSFEGLPEIESEIDQKSPHIRSGVWGTGAFKGLSPEQLTAICASKIARERIVVHKGWFKDTVPALPNGVRFAMLNVDVDLYQSAIDVLDALLAQGQLAEGAVIFFDDWNANRGSPLYGERRAWAEMVDKYTIQYSDEGGYGHGGHKFIFHSYKSPV